MGKKILMIDDDVTFADTTKKLLRKYDYEIHNIYNGENGLDYIEENYEVIDIILLDVGLPNISGYEVCRRLKLDKRFNSIPIIFLTARGGKEDKIEGIRVGAEEFLTKPFEIKELTSKLENVIKQKEEDILEKGVKHSITLTFESGYEYIKEVNHLISQIYTACDLSPEELDDIRLAFCEIGVNAIEHGNLEDPTKVVKVNYKIYKDRLELEIEDEGSGFILEAIGEPTEEENILRGRGRGIFITRKLVDDLKYEKGGSRAILVKYFDNGKTGR
ncbi:MAG: response regulator [Armatimonadota bacterium]